MVNNVFFATDISTSTTFLPNGFSLNGRGTLIISIAMFDYH
jgi:hypothetical protein